MGYHKRPENVSHTAGARPQHSKNTSLSECKYILKGLGLENNETHTRMRKTQMYMSSGSD